MRLSRRLLLRATAALAGLSWPAWMPRLAFAAPHEAPLGDVLVVIFLRGAADALNMVVPHGEAAYYAQRPTLAIPRPDDGRAPRAQRAVELDGFFGLHPALAPLLPAWQAKQLAVVHACGAPDESRSHFQAMALMERGVADEQGPASGWIGRHLATLETGNLSPLRAVAAGTTPPRSLGGSVPIAALRSIVDFHREEAPEMRRLQAALTELYSGAGALQQLGQESLALLASLQTLDPQRYRPASTRPYPESDFGLALRQIAMLIKAEVGLEVAAIDLGGWDTHLAQGGSEGQMAALLADLAAGLAAFHEDLLAQASRLSLVVMSEFGRRVQENGSLGTDHGHGGLMLLLGGEVRGGQIHGEWPGLAREQLVGPGDLAVTTDYRDVLAELCLKRLKNPHLDQLFPGYSPAMPGLWGHDMPRPS